jgi:fibronectin-binding autotransporter adhesin
MPVQRNRSASRSACKSLSDQRFVLLNRRKFRLAVAAIPLSGLLLTCPVRAAVDTWTGAIDNLWNDHNGFNWGGNNPPASGDSLVFTAATGNGGTALNDNLTSSGFNIAGITFNSGAAAFDIGDGFGDAGFGNVFTLTGNIVNNSTNTEIIDNNFSSNGNSIQANSGNITLNGLLTLGSSTINFSGAQTTTLAGVGTSTSSGGNFEINGGNLVFGNGFNISDKGRLNLEGGTGSVIVNIGAGNTIAFGGNRGDTANYIGVDGSTESLTVSSGTLAYINGTDGGTGTGSLLIGNNGNTAHGTLTIDGGTVNVGTRVQLAAGYPNDTAGAWVNQGGGNTGVININGGLLEIGTGSTTDSDLGWLEMRGPSDSGGGSATVNLGNGTAGSGTLSLVEVAAGTQTSGSTEKLTFNGGTLQARVNNTNFLNAHPTLSTIISTGGGTIDTQTYNVTITSPLIHDSSLGASADGGLTKIGSGTLILSGTSTYTGGTTVSAGTLNVNGSISATGTVSVSGGATLGGSGTVGAVTLAAGSTAGTQGSLSVASTAVLTVGQLSIGGTVGNSSNLVFGLGASTSNKLVISGPFTIGAGGGAVALQNSGLLAGTTYTLATFPDSGSTTNGAAFVAGTGASLDGLTLAAPPFGSSSNTLTLTTGTTDTLTLTTGSVQPAPGTAYWKGTNGTSWNSYSGSNANFTTDAMGASFAQAYPASTSDVIFAATGATNLTNTLGQDFDIKSLSFTAQDTTPANVAAVSISGANNLQIEAGGITNGNVNGVTLNMTTLIPNVSQAWTNSSGAAALNVSASVTGTAGTGNTTTLTLANNSSSAMNLTGVIGDGAGGGKLALTISNSGTGVVNLTNVNTFTGQLTVSAGVVSVPSASNAGTAQPSGEGSVVALNGGTWRLTQANYPNPGFTLGFNTGANGGTLDNAAVAGSQYTFYAGTLTGTGALAFIDSATSGTNSAAEFWLITGNSPAFSGPVSIGTSATNSGVVQYRSGNANPLGTGTITINAKGILSADLGNGTPIPLANNIVLNGGALDTQSASMTYSGSVTLSAGTTSTVGWANNQNAALALSGVISGSGALKIADVNGTSSNTVTFSNSNTFSGSTTLNIGTLDLKNSLALQNSQLITGGGGAVTFDSAAAGSGTAFTVGGLSGNGNLALQNTAGAVLADAIALTVGNNAGSGSTPTSSSYSGVLSGFGSILKTGSGTQTLTNASNSYTGATFVNAGTLALSSAGSTNNIANSSAISVAAGATLNVAGLSSGTIVLNPASGTAHTGGQVLGGGSTSAAGTVTGNITAAGGAVVSAGSSTALGTGAATAVGTLSTGGQTWGSNGEFSEKINAATGTAGTDWDQINMTSLSVTATGADLNHDFYIAPVATLTGLTYGSQYTWVIGNVSSGGATGSGGAALATGSNLLGTSVSTPFALDTSGFTAATAAGALPTAQGNFTLELITGAGITGENIQLQYTATPEPGTTLLVLGGVMPLLGGRRRRRKS